MSVQKEPPTEKRKFTLDFFKNTVKLVIGKGENKVEIDVPSQHLCDHSEFFRAACSDRWSSGREGVVHLEDEDPKIFSLFLAWAFQGSIESAEDYVTFNPKHVGGSRGSASAQHLQLIDCFLLGQRLLAPEFKNATMDLLIGNYKLFYEEFRDIPTNSTFANKIYAETNAGSPLRRSLVDTILASSRPDFFTSEFSRDGHESTKYYEEFLVEVLTAAHPFFKSDKSFPRSRVCYKRDRCEYHEHPNKSKGYLCTET